MLTDTAQPAEVQTYAALLAEAKLAALKALADILATSDDPKEKRLAATAILRTPEAQDPDAPPSAAKRPPRRTRPDQDPQPSHASASVTASDLTPAQIAAAAARARAALRQAGIPVDDNEDPFEILNNLPAADAIRIARSVRRRSD